MKKSAAQNLNSQLLFREWVINQLHFVIGDLSANLWPKEYDALKLIGFNFRLTDLDRLL